MLRSKLDQGHFRPHGRRNLKWQIIPVERAGSSPRDLETAAYGKDKRAPLK